MSRTVWIDVSDLIHYLSHHSRPSGIQRVVYELSRALAALQPGQVRLVHRTDGPCDYEVLDTHWVDALFTTVVGREDKKPRERTPLQMDSLVTSPDAEVSVSSALRTQMQAFGQLLRLPAGIATWRRKQAAVQQQAALNRQAATMPASAPASNVRLKDVVRAGDIFFVPGSPWHYPNYARTVRWLRDECRVSFGLLIHDLIPLLHPEWCDRGVITTFTQWHRAVVPLADRIFVTSQAVAADVENWLSREGLAPAHPVTATGMGSTFSSGQTLPVADVTQSAKLPEPGSYVLFVSTLEARKNHTLLFRVWRRLLEERPADEVPTLVFAGRVGWLVSDLMQQLENADWLNGKIRLISGATDQELAALYRGCRFTVFPSLFEGWGLPVTESLCSGRPCVASGTTAVPEAGGEFARYFNPEDTDDALNVIRSVLDDPAGLEAWQKKIAASYQPLPWTVPADRVLKSFGF